MLTLVVVVSCHSPVLAMPGIFSIFFFPGEAFSTFRAVIE